ncbi:MAG TPA: dihydrofolate reductase family protein [Kribbella sp.]|nr:dihydrofolate reductase family protein [Kribbella sp.]
MSCRLTRADWTNTRLIRTDVERELLELKAQPGKDIAILGSSPLTVDLWRLGLVDELRLLLNLVVLGSGASLLAGADLTRFDLARTRQFSTGTLQLTYTPNPSHQPRDPHQGKTF